MFSFSLLAMICIDQVQVTPVPIKPREIFCTPSTSWEGIVTFFLLNYVAHALTITTSPRETWHQTARKVITAFLFPYTGVLRGCTTIAAAMVHKESDLQNAVRTEALCVLVRNIDDWSPMEGESIPEYRINGVNSATERSPLHATLSVRSPLNMADISSVTHSIHGEIRLPKQGYKFQVLPPKIDVCPHFDTKVELANSHNAMKSLIAVGQLLYACVTLYQTRGTQIENYGYAAYGLTVIPYAVMSLVNLIGNFLTPSYNSLYMVHSEVMAEAESIFRGGKFVGSVGFINVTEDQKDNVI